MEPNNRRRYWITYDYESRLADFRRTYAAEPTESEQWAIRIAATREYDQFIAAHERQPAALERIQ